MKDAKGIDTSRRLFLKRFSLKREATPKRFLPLPYLKQVSYEDYCQKCDMKACKEVCDEGIISINAMGVPEIVFGKKGCVFCQQCALSCVDDTLRGLFDLSYSRIDASIALLPDRCVAWNRVVCSSCKDVCGERAIEFSGLFYPQINTACTCCGFCVSVCPTEAICIKSL